MKKNMDQTPKKDFWDKLDIFLKLLVGVVVVIAGHYVNASIKHRKIDTEMIEMAVGILKTKPNQETVALRDWAIKVLNHHSEIDLDDKAQNVLRTNPLPYLANESGNPIADENGNIIVPDL